jgi:hypothetical protein
MPAEKAEGDGVTRLSFIKASAGVAAGVAAVSVPTAAGALAKEETGIPTVPSSPTPPEPVTAYVRDAARGEVTVMSGTSETTYRDRTLVQRLLAAAPQDSTENRGR